VYRSRFPLDILLTDVLPPVIPFPPRFNFSAPRLFSFNCVPAAGLGFPGHLPPFVFFSRYEVEGKVPFFIKVPVNLHPFALFDLFLWPPWSRVPFVLLSKSLPLFFNCRPPLPRLPCRIFYGALSHFFFYSDVFLLSRLPNGKTLLAPAFAHLCSRLAPLSFLFPPESFFRDSRYRRRTSFALLFAEYTFFSSFI